MHCLTRKRRWYKVSQSATCVPSANVKLRCIRRSSGMPCTSISTVTFPDSQGRQLRQTWNIWSNFGLKTPEQNPTPPLFHLDGFTAPLRSKYSQRARPLHWSASGHLETMDRLERRMFPNLEMMSITAVGFGGYYTDQDEHANITAFESGPVLREARTESHLIRMGLLWGRLTHLCMLNVFKSSIVALRTVFTQCPLLQGDVQGVPSCRPTV